NGTSGVIPNPGVAGSTYSHQYTFTVPAEWVAENLRVAAMVTEVRATGKSTVNVADVALTTVGVEEHSAASAITVFPVPANDALFVRMSDAAGTTRIQLFDGVGQLVIDRTVNARGTVQVEGFGALAPGAYMLRVQQGQRISEQRVVRVAER
ncbi:MAG TPA: T9SS type A sorting domain-containing protein, partial [Flavobacteriales bacterium]|nr:T9SS type A sorting domain-containing protein [Flavobacteriales bacterium]